MCLAEDCKVKSKSRFQKYLVRMFNDCFFLLLSSTRKTHSRNSSSRNGNDRAPWRGSYRRSQVVFKIRPLPSIILDNEPIQCALKFGILVNRLFLFLFIKPHVYDDAGRRKIGLENND
jgi:hypothetical protein